MESNSQEKRKNCFCFFFLLHIWRKIENLRAFLEMPEKFFFFSLWTINFPDKLYSLAFFFCLGFVPYDQWFWTNFPPPQMSHELNLFSFRIALSLFIQIDVDVALLDASAAFGVSSTRNGFICVRLQSAFSDNATFLSLAQYSWGTNHSDKHCRALGRFAQRLNVNNSLLNLKNRLKQWLVVKSNFSTNVNFQL